MEPWEFKMLSRDSSGPERARVAKVGQVGFKRGSKELKTSGGSRGLNN